MSDRQIQNALNKMTKLANELATEAVVRYGTSGQIFYESEGQFHIMNGDDVMSSRRQSHVKFTSDGLCRLQCGSW